MGLIVQTMMVTPPSMRDDSREARQRGNGMAQKPQAIETDIIDLTDFTMIALDKIESHALAQAIRRLMERDGDQDDPVVAFNACL
jgi:FXSXX-COOH protein